MTHKKGEKNKKSIYKKLRSPIKWLGGKGHMRAKIVPIVEAIPHVTYVEPFCGGASIFFGKQPSRVEVLNDLHSDLVGFFRMLRDKDLFAEFYELVQNTPSSREEYYWCLNNWQKLSGVERVWAWFVVARLSFGGRFGAGWGYVITESTRGMAQSVSKWLSTIDMLPQIRDRLLTAQIENLPAIEVIKKYDTPDTLFYLDPPYVSSTRKGGKYQYEMTDDDHRVLVAVLLGIKGSAVLSGYANDLYRDIESAGWKRKDWDTASHVAGRTKSTGILGKGAAKKMQRRVESVWIKIQNLSN